MFNGRYNANLNRIVMEIKNIQVFFAGDKREFSAFDQAGIISSQFASSQPKVIYITPEVEFAARYMLASSPTSSVYEQYYKAIQRDYKHKQKKAESVFETHQEHKKFKFQLDSGKCSDSVAFNGKFADINIFSRDIEKYDLDFQGVLEAAIFETGKPIIIVPPEYKAKRFDNIVIGWDGSSRASRAISSALPFLKRAKKVSIVTINEKGKDISSSKNLISYLESHLIKPTYTNMKNAKSISDSLIDFSNKENANLLILGAFAHSRFRENILGGVTKSIVKNTSTPLFMEH